MRGERDEEFLEHFYFRVNMGSDNYVVFGLSAKL